MKKWICPSCESTSFELFRDNLDNTLFIQCAGCKEHLDAPEVAFGPWEQEV